MPVFAVHYSPALVTVSVLLSMAAAYAALLLAERMRAESTARGRRLWLAGGSVAMGAGIWAMHYLGMLAIQLPVPVYYDWPIVLLSGIMAIAASAVALHVISRARPHSRHVFLGGLLMAAGIAGMHYTGMTAMRSQAMEHYNLWLSSMAIAAAAIFSWSALAIAVAVGSTRRTNCPECLRVAGGCTMGLGIAAMHYTAMAGVTFMDMGASPARNGTLAVTELGQTAVIGITVLLLLVALGLAALDRRRLEALRVAHQRLEETQTALLRSQEELQAANRTLSELSIRDGLTGLHNRRHFDAMLATETRRAARNRKSIALLMIDIDYFKRLNDTCGHQRGDDCLRAVACVLDDTPRRGYDTVARYGGEEFAILLPDCPLEAALSKAELIRSSITALALENPGSPHTPAIVTVSIGVACIHPQLGNSGESLLHAADEALYAAKRAGRNRIEAAIELSLV